MALSSDVVRQVEQDLLVKADVLAYHLGNLVVTDAERAKAAGIAHRSGEFRS